MIVEDGRYYIYTHIRLDTNIVFYIRKGTKRSFPNKYERAMSVKQRSKYWKYIK